MLHGCTEAALVVHFMLGYFEKKIGLSSNWTLNLLKWKN